MCKKPEGPIAEDRSQPSKQLREIEVHLHPLIEEATTLKKEAQASNMKNLEQSADSLVQSLSAVSKRLQSFQQ